MTSQQPAAQTTRRAVNEGRKLKAKASRWMIVVMVVVVVVMEMKLMGEWWWSGEAGAERMRD